MSVNKNPKNIFKDILIIISLSVILALVYNYFSTKPLSLIYEAPKIEYVSDSDFITKKNSFDTIQKINSENTVQIQTVEKSSEKHVDSSSKQKKISEQIPKKLEPTIEQLKYVSYEQVLKQIENPDVLFIDARSPEKYSESHIGNAINIFPYIDEHEYIEKIRNVNQNKIIIVYCDGGTCESSRKVADDLKNFGYKRIMLYEGGWEDWTKNKK